MPSRRRIEVKGLLTTISYLMFSTIFAFFISGCQMSYSNLISDLARDATILVNLYDYAPKLDTVNYQHLKGKKMCMSNIRNNAPYTSNFSYYSKDGKVRYQLASQRNSFMLLQSYFWYAYQKAFMYCGIEAVADCSTPDTPELWIVFQSFNDEELKLRIAILKNSETLYEKDLTVAMEPAATRDYQLLEKRSYEMINLTVAKILDDKGFQDLLSK
jgi:hypothetical protein